MLMYIFRHCSPCSSRIPFSIFSNFFCCDSSLKLNLGDLFNWIRCKSHLVNFWIIVIITLLKSHSIHKSRLTKTTNMFEQNTYHKNVIFIEHNKAFLDQHIESPEKYYSLFTICWLFLLSKQKLKCLCIENGANTMLCVFCMWKSDIDQR